MSSFNVPFLRVPTEVQVETLKGVGIVVCVEAEIFSQPFLGVCVVDIEPSGSINRGSGICCCIQRCYNSLVGHVTVLSSHNISIKDVLAQSQQKRRHFCRLSHKSYYIQSVIISRLISLVSSASTDQGNPPELLMAVVRSNSVPEQGRHRVDCQQVHLEPLG